MIGSAFKQGDRTKDLFQQHPALIYNILQHGSPKKIILEGMEVFHH